MRQELVVELDACLQLLTRIIGALARRDVAADSLRVHRRAEWLVLSVTLPAPTESPLSENLLDHLRETVGVLRADVRPVPAPRGCRIAEGELQRPNGSAP